MRLDQTNPYTWHRLQSHPDRLDKSGPTGFQASWSVDPVSKNPIVSTRDGAGCPCWSVTGNDRINEYLTTDVVDTPTP